jgi:large subunit ribosomal protein L25
MADTLKVELRKDLGKHNTRRLRRVGSIPAILYGHQQEPVCLSLSAEELESAVRRGSRLVSLAGALAEKAFIRDLQWDTFGLNVMHVDLTRISEHEVVEVHLAIELRGEAPGVREGGVIKHLIHTATIQCRATDIPEKLYVNVNHLKLGDVITVANLEIPEGAKLVADPEEIVVECVQPAAEPEEEGGEPVPGEPEVIGRKKEDEEEGAE